MLTSKGRRERLLKSPRPRLRRFDAQNLRDLGIVWAEYSTGNFYLPAGLSNDEFVDQLLSMLAIWDSLWFVEDASTQFSSGTGPVALVSIRSDGWRIEPHMHHFSWSTTRQKLRSVIALLQMLRHDKNVGVVFCVVEERLKHFFDHVCQYGVLFPKGRLLQGLPTGTAFMYSIKGKRTCLRHSEQSEQASASLPD